MKNNKFFYLILTSIVILAIGCEGPMGPAGPAGPAGADGIDGADGSDGTDGVDGNAVCLTCHNVAKKDSILTDYGVSRHGTSGTFYPGSPTVVEYAGGRNDCAKCHSNEGFVETNYTGLDTTAADIPLPQPIQCETCHDFHATLDFENDGPDYALRTKSAVTLLMDSTTLDFENNGNLCANCHQPRRPGPVDEGGGNFTVTSTHYGPHHGPQSTLLEGKGGYEIAGSISYPTSQTTHRTSSSCTSCHMHESSADGEGGHTWNVPLDACTTCHSDATDFDIDGVQTEIEGLIATLEDKLFDAGLVDADGHPVPGTYPVDEVGGLYNYGMMVDDRSDGVHNYPYIKALLQNSIEIFP